MRSQGALMGEPTAQGSAIDPLEGVMPEVVQVIEKTADVPGVRPDRVW